MASHHDKELELMLHGSKPLAGFTQEEGMPRNRVIPAGFDEALASGKLVYQAAPVKPPQAITHYFARPDEAWRMRVMARYVAHDFLHGSGHNAFDLLDDQRFRGYMYGYDPDEIEDFVTRRAHGMHAAGAMASRDMILREGAGRLPHDPAIVPGVDHDASRAPAELHLADGHPLTLSFRPEDRWRALVVVAVLDDVPRWKIDTQRRDDHMQLLRFVMDSNDDALRALFDNAGIHL